ncbi:MAG: hypothetical protein JRG82_14385 [Deltaproteobacteria bacterium]|nr:hypothetical protein [Deltaproteobacteria bacterium]
MENRESRLRLYRSADTNYWTDDWSTDFYRLQARAGLISIAFEHDRLGPVLLPEMQSAYAVLDWPDLHLSRSMKRWMRSEAYAQGGYGLRMGHDLQEILAGVRLAHGDHNWLSPAYADLLARLAADGEVDGFEVMTAGLVSQPTGRLVAGEVGYRVGRVYTSLTGFFDRRDPSLSNVGTLQLARLRAKLEFSDFAFWNLGHPSLQYKIDLGAKVVPRAAFLARWFSGPWD